MIALLICWAARADELQAVHAGETVESIAAELGDPTLAGQIRALNRLPPGGQPTVGSLLRLPMRSDQRAQQAFFLTIEGRVTVRDASATPWDAAPFDPLPPDAELCTAASSRATLRLASTCNSDGSASDDLQLQPETCLRVRTALSSLAGRSTVVDITRGSVTVLDQLDGRGELTVVTPAGLTSGQRGGFRVTVEPEAARTEAFGGATTVAGGGAEVALAVGQGSRVRPGEPPSAPVELLRAGPLDRPAHDAVLVRPDFAWTAVDGAVGYRFEIASTEGFVELLYVEDTPEPAHRPQPLLLPYAGLRGLWWRVSALDRYGFIGVPGEPRRLALPTALR